jgi:hypothetical protein
MQALIAYPLARPRAPRRRLVHLLHGLLAALVVLALAPLPARAAYYHLYVAGDDLGGTIVVDGGSAPPAGTCGAHFHNPDAWYWAQAADGASETGPLANLPNNGVATSDLTLTGKFAATCSNDPYLAVTPATPSGWVPAEAISLVVEASPEDVEWLSSSGNPMGDPFEWHGFPVFDPCEVEEFCEELTLNYCDVHPTAMFCDEADDSEESLLQIGDLAASIPHRTEIARGHLTAGRRTDASAALTLARQRVSRVTGQLAPLRQRQLRMAHTVATDLRSAGAEIALGNLSAGYEFGIRHATLCDKALSVAQSAISAGRTPDWTAVDAACRPAADPLASSRTWLGRLLSWATPATR